MLQACSVRNSTLPERNTDNVEQRNDRRRPHLFGKIDSIEES